MGQLVDGVWKNVWYDTSKTGGAFVRSTAKFRNWITADGAAGPSGDGGFKAEAGRYHLYVSYACPWAHRTLIFRELKGLQDLIGVSVVHPDMLSDGWTFDTDFAGATGDRLHGLPFLRDVYLQGRPRDLGPGDGAGTLGPGTRNDRVERILRDHPHVQLGLRRSDGEPRRLLARGPARRDRDGERARLRHGQQRRLSRRVRHHAGRLRRRRSWRFSSRSTGSRTGWPRAAISWATGSPKRTGGW